MMLPTPFDSLHIHPFPHLSDDKVTGVDAQIHILVTVPSYTLHRDGSVGQGQSVSPV